MNTEASIPKANEDSDEMSIVTLLETAIPIHHVALVSTVLMGRKETLWRSSRSTSKKEETLRHRISVGSPRTTKYGRTKNKG